MLAKESEIVNSKDSAVSKLSRGPPNTRKPVLKNVSEGFDTLKSFRL